MNKKVLLIIALIAPVPGYGYELGTHARVTNAAYLRSVLTVDGTLIPRLGIQADGNAFGEDYYDVYQGDVYTRTKNDFEESANRMPSGVNPLSIPGWLMRGAIREDDVPQLFGSNPADPYGSIFRIFNHFYDPRNDRGLTLGAFQGKKAPDWGIGALDAFANSNTADQFRRNHFTVFDAREAMYRALTGMNKVGSKAIGAGGVEPSSASDKEAVRKAYWATTFRALGDLVHLIQDMAQPQHTRNDPHAGSDDYSQPAGPEGHASFYEKYIEQRAVQGTVGDSSGNSSTFAALVYDATPSYPIPQFNDYVSYFSTRNVDVSGSNRSGMTDFRA